MHFYMANMNNMRKALFPAFVTAYDNWCVSNDTRELEQLVTQAATHWQDVAETCLEIHKENRDNCEPALISVIEANVL